MAPLSPAAFFLRDYLSASEKVNLEGDLRPDLPVDRGYNPEVRLLFLLRGVRSAQLLHPEVLRP